VEGQGGAAEEGSLDHMKGLVAITRMLLESKSEIYGCFIVEQRLSTEVIVEQRLSTEAMFAV
jgi:hypothetical protein